MAASRRLPMVELSRLRARGAEGAVPLVDLFKGSGSLRLPTHPVIAGGGVAVRGVHRVREPFTRLEFLDAWDARFVIVNQGPIDDALAYRGPAGNTMTWYSTAPARWRDIGAPPGGGFQVNAFRPTATRFRTYNAQGGGTEQLSHTFPLIGLLRCGHQEEWQDVPEDGRRRRPTAAGRDRRRSPTTPSAHA